jgi:flagellar biosynthesis protein
MNFRWFNQKHRRELNGRSAAVIRYDEGKDRAPTIVAHGKGAVANQIIALAKENGIPLQEDPLLVENLIDMDLGDNIPPQLYSVIAEILLMLKEMERES